MSLFFKSTAIAANALYGDFKFKPYYNMGFHLDALTSFICHIVRALYNLASIALRVLITPLCLLNPLAWLSLPDHALNLIDDLVGFVISLAPIIIHPLIFLVRTLTSVMFGYEQQSENDGGIEDEQNDLSLAMTLF